MEPSPETDPQEIQHSQYILRLLERVDKLSVELHKHIHVAPRSRLEVDDARTPHYPVSGYAYAQLLAALGCLESLRSMSVREDAETINMTMSPFGAYALIRNSLDAAGAALWLLEPESSTGRVKRRIMLGLDEVKNGAALRETMGQDSDGWKERKRARMKEVAQQAAVGEWNPLREPMPSMTRILRSLERLHQNVLFPWLAAWQLASGHAHAKLWAQAASNQLDEMSGTRTDTGATYRVTIKFGMVAALLFEAVQLIEAAGARYIELGTVRA